MGQILSRSKFDTPVGPMVALTSTKGRCALEFELPDRQKLLTARLKQWFSEYELEPMNGAGNTPMANWLTAYFRREFLPPPTLDLRGSSFEQTVWKALLTIPAAQTTTYGILAANLGIPGPARAIGTAVRRNPISLIVPCHRVTQKQWLPLHERLETEAR